MNRIAISVLLVVGLTSVVITAQEEAAKPKVETKEAKIARALSAGPANIAKAAKVVDRDGKGREIVLREGKNGFTCFPGHPTVVDDIAYCANADALQWEEDWHGHKPKPTNPQPGIEYMLAGGTYWSATDPYATSGTPLHGRSPLDNSVALRPGNNWPARATEADWNLDYVGWDALLPPHDQSASLSGRPD